MIEQKIENSPVILMPRKYKALFGESLFSSLPGFV